MKKKVFICMLCLAAVVATTAGCGSSPEDKTSSTESDKKQESGNILDSLKEIEVDAASIEDVERFLTDTDENTILVDARPQEAYSGWKTEGAVYGGHLQGAALFSARWLDCDYSASAPREVYLQRSMEDEDITKEKQVIVYDYSGKQAKQVAQYFKLNDIENVSYFQADELIDKGEYLESYENYDRFIPSEIVKNISDIKTGKVTEINEDTREILGDDLEKVILVDVGWGNMEESNYLSIGHVPGAIHINTDSYERPHVYVPEKRSDYAREWRLIPLEQFRDEVCTQHGISKDSTVIITGGTTDAQGRLGFMLRSVGVKTYIMSGALTAWTYNGYELEKENKTIPVAVAEFGSDTIAAPNEILWMDDAKKIQAGEIEGQLIDSRGKEEYDGKSTGYGYHDLAGHIEGSLWCPQRTDEEGEFFENVDTTPRTQKTMLKQLEKHDVDTSKLMVFFCGDSWGAAKISYWAQSVDIENIIQWGNGWIPWSNSGNEFIDHNGDKVHYDKYLDTVVDEDGNDKGDGINILDNKEK